MIGLGLKLGKILKNVVQSTSNWILSLGTWNDSNQWIDSESWND
jgi:hypothetical protein